MFINLVGKAIFCKNTHRHTEELFLKTGVKCEIDSDGKRQISN